MFSVPRRSHTTGHMLRGHVHENRPLNRIMRKLSDVRVETVRDHAVIEICFRWVTPKVLTPT